MLIESPAGESEHEFRLYVTGLLAEIYGHLPDWLVFKVGRRFEHQGKCFREFLCPSGSVDGRIQLHAEKPEGVLRAIIIQGTHANVAFCAVIRGGIETEFHCDELRLAD